ncbi:hypothetical protein CXB51_031193 [Gossypium anomalum]|uniref:Endonuclease/exonuclease/phosphatase domain-containing protein n=1 Tax=Gossypium anomalum TaxID=47600 RepID=A0A8J5YQ43_9ROSI|nr:hypothetical protein CXB51_031193 [Gossypium anomalum]
METKFNVRRIENIQRYCGYSHGIDIGANGSKGEFSLGWKTNMKVTLRSFSNHNVDVEVYEESSDIKWRPTGFYGHPEGRHRLSSWNLLQRPGTDQSLPWLVVGDFNEITYSFEKSGGRVRGERQMQDFQSALLDCDLHDLEEPKDDTLLELTDIRLQLNLEADGEERYWKQCGRINWLKYRDHNTKFFHGSTTAKRKFNLIKGLMNDIGEWVEDEKGTEAAISGYF